MHKLQTPTAVEKAEIRLAGIKSIDPALDLGKGLSVAAYSELIEEIRKQVSDYNAMISAIEAYRLRMHETEAELRGMTSKILSAVALEFGKESNEYKQAGGVRPSERKKSESKKSESAEEK